jgi:hypothetical protein
VDNTEDNGEVNGTSFCGTFLVGGAGESGFTWLVKSRSKQGAEDVLEPHRVDNRFVRRLFPLPSTGEALLTDGRDCLPRIASADENPSGLDGSPLPA